MAKNKAFTSIMAGLNESLSYAKGDESSARKVSVTVSELPSYKDVEITMCRAFEEYGDEVRNETRTSERLSFARDLIRQNKLSLEEISAVSHLPLEQVQEIAEQLLEK